MSYARLGAGLQLRDRSRGFLPGQRPAMPALLVLNKRDAGTFECLGQNHQRLRAQTSRSQYLDDFFDVMAIDFFCSPAECFEAAFINIQIMFESRWLALAQPIDID